MRATRSQMDARRTALVEIVDAGAPLSVRHVFYQATGLGLVPKTNGGYLKCQRLILEMRRSGRVGYDQIVDGTRYVRRAKTYDSLDGALYATSRTYRRNLWSESPYQIEIWAESDSIAGTIWPAADEWAVPLFVTRGYASETFLWNSAAQWRGDRDVVVLYVGDFDPHGLQIESTSRSRTEAFAGTTVDWRRIAITPEQVTEFGLPTSYGGHGVEAEALDATVLRALLTATVLEYVDEAQVAVLRVAEESEREILRTMREQLA